VWVPETLRTLCDVLILVDQSAEPVVSLDVVDRGWGVAGEGSQGSGLAEGVVRPMSVVVALELAEYGCGVSWLMIRRRSRSSRRRVPTKRSAMALARGARTGVLMILMSVAVHTVSTVAVNLVSWSRIRNLRRGLASSRFMQRLRASWVSHAAVGWAVMGEDVDAAGGVLDDEERVEPVEGDRVDVEHVAGQDRLGLRSEELGPGRSGPSGCGVDPGGVQDRPDR
jgi:hypothetical protein